MYDPSMRVLTVLEVLQAKERVTVSELAARLEVSDRTVQRYVARLQDLGVPVSSTRGHGAAYRLKPSFRMPPIMFNTEEAFAVALGLNALQHVGLTALAPAVTGVESKLERILPTAIWGRMQAVTSALQLEKSPWVTPVDTALVTTLTEAIESRVQVDMHYANGRSNSSSRTVQPLGLVRDDGTWFLSAYCLLRQDLRLFRADRILETHVTQVSFTPPPDFDVRGFTTRRLQDIPTSWRVEVWLEATSQTLRYDLLSTRADLHEESNGFVLRCGVNDLVGFAARLLELGCPFKIRAPLELKAAFGTLSERAAQVYATET